MFRNVGATMTSEIDGYFIDVGAPRALVLPDVEVERASAGALAAEILRGLAPLMRPLSFDLIVLAYSRNDEAKVHIDQPLWFVVEGAAEIELGLEAHTGSPTIRRVEQLDPETIDSFIRDVTSRVPTDAVATYERLASDGVEVRLPASLAKRNELVLGIPVSAVVPVIHRDGSAFARGPRRGELAPLSIRLTGPEPRLTITSNWSLWAPGGPGEADLEAIIDGFVARGWLRN